MDVFISDLITYSLKGGRGESTEAVYITPTGPAFDRRWMVVTDDGQFCAQRRDTKRKLGVELRSLGQIKTMIDERNSRLLLSAPNMSELSLPLAERTDGQRIDVQVWEDQCWGRDMGVTASNWATQFLSRERPGRYHFIRMPDEGTRTRKKDPAFPVSFADGYPELVISCESLRDLNRRIIARGGRELPMNRFRPNIVLDGLEAYAEDRIASFTVGSGTGKITFIFCKPCERCAVIQTDQETMERGAEPLATLSTYRKIETPDGHPVIFGSNYRHEGRGMIAIGDKVEVTWQQAA